jgi:hypothetical protein
VSERFRPFAIPDAFEDSHKGQESFSCLVCGVPCFYFSLVYPLTITLFRAWRLFKHTSLLELVQ